MVRAAVMEGPGEPLRVKDFPSPEPEEGAVILETVYSEVCGTDVHLAHGRLEGVPYPLIPGHFSVGRVLQTGGTVHTPDGERVECGELVTFMDVHETCGDCWYCLVARASTRCPQRRVYGITYSAGEGLLGGWSERIYLRPGVKVVRLKGIPPRTFIAGGCGLPTAFHAIERGEVSLGETVVVRDEVDWEGMITHEFDLEDADEALRVIENEEGIKAVIRP